jgi:iron(III) transport system substrate-binding protein
VSDPSAQKDNGFRRQRRPLYQPRATPWVYRSKTNLSAEGAIHRAEEPTPGKSQKSTGALRHAIFVTRAAGRLIQFAGAFFLLFLTIKIGKAEPHVIAYCAQDQVYAEPIFQQFEKATGIKVLPIYDNEAVKTVGLANRLIAERHHPVCDVFWGNEEMRTRQLAAQNVFRETNGWVGFGYRSRRIVVNTNQLSLASAPHSLFELTNATWRGKLALAYPQFGTTATHFQVLRQRWGDAFWQSWCRALAANKPFVVDGNSEVVKAVGRGEARVGLTDSDDIADGQREGLPVAALPMSNETLLIPNTVAIIRGAPDPKPAQRLFEYLQGRTVVEALVRAHAIEGATPDEIGIATLRVNWAAALRDLEPATTELNQIFLR